MISRCCGETGISSTQGGQSKKSRNHRLRRGVPGLYEIVIGGEQVEIEFLEEGKLYGKHTSINKRGSCQPVRAVGSHIPVHQFNQPSIEKFTANHPFQERLSAMQLPSQLRECISKIAIPIHPRGSAANRSPVPNFLLLMCTIISLKYRRWISRLTRRNGSPEYGRHGPTSDGKRCPPAAISQQHPQSFRSGSSFLPMWIFKGGQTGMGRKRPAAGNGRKKRRAQDLSKPRFSVRM